MDDIRFQLFNCFQFSFLSLRLLLRNGMRRSKINFEQAGIAILSLTNTAVFPNTVQTRNLSGCDAGDSSTGNKVQCRALANLCRRVFKSPVASLLRTSNSELRTHVRPTCITSISVPAVINFSPRGTIAKPLVCAKLIKLPEL